LIKIMSQIVSYIHTRKNWVTVYLYNCIIMQLGFMSKPKQDLFQDGELVNRSQMEVKQL
jgi:hypothetical protein